MDLDDNDRARIAKLGICRPVENDAPTWMDRLVNFPFKHQPVWNGVIQGVAYFAVLTVVFFVGVEVFK